MEDSMDALAVGYGIYFVAAGLYALFLFIGTYILDTRK